jgi:hypothetical protein
MILIDVKMKVQKNLEKYNLDMFFMTCDWDEYLWYLFFNFLNIK